MDFVQIGDGAIALRHLDDLGDRRDVPFHGVDGFEGDELGCIRVGLRQQLAEVLSVVMAEDPFLRPRMTDALDHGRMIERIGEDDAARQKGSEGRERRLVGDVARRKQQRRFLAVEVREFLLKQHVIVVGA